MAKITYATNGKRDYHDLELMYNQTYEKLLEDTWKYDNNRKLVIEYLKACKKGEVKSGKRYKRIGKSSLYRVLGILKLLSEEWIKKDFEQTTQEDWDKFYNDMEEDIIINAYGKKFKPSSRAKNYKTIRKFLKWKFGEDKEYPSFCVKWITTEETPTKIFLSRAEVEKMINAAYSLKVKTYLMMLFDGGFRVEELANLRWTDVTKPEGKEYYRADIRKETSKTKEARKVSLWLATDLIDSYRNDRKKALGEDFNEEDFIFNTGYQTVYRTIKRIAQRVLNKNISPHSLRHSSATYYSDIVKTYQQFCSRYGWKLKSGTAQRYFHGSQDDEIAVQAKDHEIAKFKTEFEQMRVRNRQLEENMKNMKQDIIEQILQLKKENPETLREALKIKNVREGEK